MSKETRSQRTRRTSTRPRALGQFRPSRYWGLAFLSLLTAISGCNGCFGSQGVAKKAQKAEKDKTLEEKLDEDLKKKNEEKAKKKPDISVQTMRIMPYDIVRKDVPASFAKRGHWVSVMQRFLANHNDIRADLRSRSVDTTGNPYDVDQTIYTLVSSRPLPLRKGEIREAESIFFVPNPRKQGRRVMFQNDVVRASGGLAPDNVTQPITLLAEHEYMFLVLSRRPSSFVHLSQLNSVRPKLDYLDTADESTLHYRVLLPQMGQLERHPPIPSNPLAMTSLAYILWEDYDPTTLTPAQEQAIIDWLHFGGQLIVDGSTSLDALKGSFLDPFLPAHSIETVNLKADDLAPLSKNWSVPTHHPSITTTIPMTEAETVLGVKLAANEGGEFLPNCGELVCERRLGHGRIVVTGFSLVAKPILNWRGFDNFFNACLLRRPSRKYDKKDDFIPVTLWDDPAFAFHQRDARLTTTLRFFTRDLGYENEERIPLIMKRSVDPDQEMYQYQGFGGASPSQRDDLPLSQPKSDDYRFVGHISRHGCGIASWNDYSGVADSSRTLLKDAAGITIPSPNFVMKMIMAYLVVLVPVNWLFFRLIGRLEWAWVAAPFIAVGGALAVVRSAQLDIGFARSRSEVGILELHGDHHRGHLTRYSAMYTSLSSGYDLTFSDDTTLSQPFAVGPSFVRLQPTPTPVDLRRDTELHLSGVKVASNSTGLVHSEQMFDCKGALSLRGNDLRGFSLVNDTNLSLRDVGVIRRVSKEQYEGAFLDSSDPGVTTPIQFQAIGDPIGTAENWEPPFAEWRSNHILCESAPSPTEGRDNRVRLWRLARLALRQLRMVPGETRLIAWIPSELAGVVYRPEASQTNAATFVVCHLSRPSFPPPKGDSNCLLDVMSIQDIQAKSKESPDDGRQRDDPDQPFDDANDPDRPFGDPFQQPPE